LLANETAKGNNYTSRPVIRAENNTTTTKRPLVREEGKNELLQKLQAKIEALKGNRRQDTQEQKRIKRQLDNLKRLKKKHEKMNKKREKSVPNVIAKKKEAPVVKKPTFNEEGKMVFSKFDFSESGVPENRKKKGAPATKDYKQQLEKVQKEKSKFEEVMQKDPTKAKSMKEKQTWQKAIQKAEGIKVRDDPELLKRSIKRKEKLHKKSKKQWEQREETVQEKLDKRQKKRKDNIKTRRDDKVKHKIKRAMKKGRYVPV